MNKISFECDYNNGAHPKVLQALVDTNSQQSLTYGADEWSDRAKQKIRTVCGCPDADIFFLVGGTQTNATVIDGMLMPYEAVVTVTTGHICTHEAGAIEATGRKIISLPAHNGILDAKDLDSFMHNFVNDETRDHYAQPGLVYISFPSEYGTIYSARQLDDIYQVCRRYGLKLYVDGARLGYALMSPANDITIEYLARHCDAFYIGGTKCGTLCGEAIVFPAGKAPGHFFTTIKRHGALLAKGRLAGVQYDALFTDNLYFDICKHAIDMAMKLKEIFTKRGYKFSIDSPTNQQFIILDNERMEKLGEHVIFSHWEPYDETHTVCRFVTSWATSPADLEELERRLDE
jgi:threonine aldolase